MICLWLRHSAEVLCLHCTYGPRFNSWRFWCCSVLSTADHCLVWKWTVQKNKLSEPIQHWLVASKYCKNDLATSETVLVAFCCVVSSELEMLRLYNNFSLETGLWGKPYLSYLWRKGGLLLVLLVAAISHAVFLLLLLLMLLLLLLSCCSCYCCYLYCRTQQKTNPWKHFAEEN